MGLIDSIIGVESGGNPNATNPNSSATGDSGSLSHVRLEFITDARVRKLLFAGCPSAVFRRVITVNINAIQRMFFGRFRAHIAKKCLKAFSPAATNLNAARTVVSIRDMLFVLASRDHSAPRVIFAGRGDALGKSSRSAVGSDGVSTSAAASRRIARSKVGNGYDLFDAAITYAKHLADRTISVLSDFRRGFGNGRQFPEFYSDAVYGGCH